MAKVRYPALPALAAAAALVVSGCGADHHVHRSAGPSSRPSASTRVPPLGKTLPAPRSTGIAPSPAAVKVIQAWSTALRDGHLAAAAGYFALPSTFVNGAEPDGRVPVLRIRSLRQAEAVNASLPCGAKFISADQRGEYVNALFRLTGRPGAGGSDCSPTGATARTNFIISGGKIVEWLRAPDDPGDNSGPSTNPTPVQPPSPQGAPIV